MELTITMSTTTNNKTKKLTTTGTVLYSPVQDPSCEKKWRDRVISELVFLVHSQYSTTVLYCTVVRR